ncbi:MAG: hypothetical protein CM1200mP6_06160 [Anaerolineaceae bacterium]|nr:MAG: hypothetical protein CM1200mP6_06160 [Anaerolineaceae bacterium]
MFGEHTANHIGSHMAIVLDGKVISSPVIRDAIPSGSGVISGDLTLKVPINWDYSCVMVHCRDHFW